MVDINDLKIEDVISYLKNKNYYIFGTGAVAKRFFKYLKRNEIDNRAIAFVVSDNLNDNVKVEGKDIYCINKVNRDMPLVLAVHSSLINEIIIKLQCMRFKDFVWIYPYLFELDYSSPICQNAVLDVEEIIKCQHYIYSHVVYYLAIEEYFGLNNFGKALYIKFMSSFSEAQTANKRWDIFRNAIKKFQAEGFSQDYNIKVNHKHDIILDGAHRLMLAKFYGVKKIKADIYKCELSTYLDASGDIALTEKRMYEVFNDYEISIIYDVYNRL